MSRFSSFSKLPVRYPTNTGSRLGVLIAALMCTSGPAVAAAISWNAGTGEWFVAANWDPALVPTAVDVASVNNGGTAQSVSATPAIVNTLAVGSGAEVSQSGTVNLGGGLQANLAVVGFASGVGSTATGTLIVNGGMSGLHLVGVAQNSSAIAGGSVAVTSGNATLGAQGLAVGRSFSAGASASGSVEVLTGTLRAGAGAPQFWTVGLSSQAAVMGSVAAASVDTSSGAIQGLVVGSASNGGTATGSLQLGAGNLDVVGNVDIGIASMATGGTANGTMSLGGTLAAQGALSQLSVGIASGANLFATETASANGTLEADGVTGFRNVGVGRASGYAALASSGTGHLDVGAGGIVNTTNPGGTLSIGATEGVTINGVFPPGPGGVASGSATVGGDIAGYNLVDVGRVENIGTAEGSLDLANATLVTNLLRIGTVSGSGGAPTAAGGLTDSTGRVSVVDGAIEIAQGSPVPGLVQIGTLFNPDPGISNRANGTLELTRASLTNGFVQIGGNGGQGSLLASDNSVVDVNSLGVGGQGGVGLLSVVDSNVSVRAAPDSAFDASMSVGSGGGTGEVNATNATITIEDDLLLARTGTLVPNEGRMTLVDSGMEIGGSVGIGNFGPDSQAELVLVNSEVTIGESLFLGSSANNGTLFGDALLSVDASLLEITGNFIADIGARTYFGIAGLGRGLGGYGAIDTAFARLNGLITIDFARLGSNPGFASAVFDLIFSRDGFDRDFAFVELLNLPDRYVAVHGIELADAGDVWRLRLTEAVFDVPEPRSLELLLAAVLVFGLLRFGRRQGLRIARAMH